MKPIFSRLVVLLALAGGMAPTLAADRAQQPSPAVPPSSNALQQPGRPSVESCIAYTNMVGGFMDVAQGDHLRDSLEFLAFEDAQKKGNAADLVVLERIESHGDAALHYFKDPGLRRGFVMSSCLYSIPPQHAMKFAAYFAAMCPRPAGGTWSSECFMPAAQKLAQCIKAAGGDAGKDRCLAAQ